VIASLPAASLLDVGAGDAFFAQTLLEEWPELRITCFDPGYEERPLGLSARPQHATFVSDEPTESYDAVALLDVIEHVEDDVAVLGNLVAHRLRRGGHLLFSVPAWPLLFSHHDRQLKHHRRYTPKAASDLLRHCGLEITSSGGLFHAPLIARSAIVLKERRIKSDGPLGAPAPLRWTGTERARRVVESMLSADAKLSRLAARAGLGVPGLSWWSLCRKP
jgi:SAM-dependent methyltransferase